MGCQHETDPSFAGCSIKMNGIDLATKRDVITSCDYETCWTIKSNNGNNTIFVVKSDGMLQ